MNDELAIKLLKVSFSVTSRVQELSDAGIELSMPSVDDELFDIVLKEYGVPNDNTTTHEEGQPIFCRDWFYNEYFDTVKKGDDRELTEFIEKIKSAKKSISEFYYTDDVPH